MIVFSTCLAVLLVVSNAVWLYFFLQFSRDSARERWSLQERIREPENAQPNPEPKQMTHEETRVLDNWVSKTEAKDEFDAVGRIDPELPLRNSNESN